MVSMASYSQKLGPQEHVACHACPARLSVFLVTWRKTCSKHAMRTRPLLDAHVAGLLGSLIPVDPTHPRMVIGEDTSNDAPRHGRAYNVATTDELKRNINDVKSMT